MLSNFSFAQIDTIQEVNKTHSPKKAGILSAVLPGAGQVYNKKWWKVPIVYAGLGASAYFFDVNQYNFKGYRDLYIETGDLEVFNAMEDSRRWRDISAMAFIAVYGLQVVDAIVDAHLFYFDVSDDLSFNWTPTLIQKTYATRETSFGLAMRIQF